MAKRLQKETPEERGWIFGFSWKYFWVFYKRSGKNVFINKTEKMEVWGNRVFIKRENNICHEYLCDFDVNYKK